MPFSKVSNESNNLCYFRNDVSDITQYEKPSSLPPSKRCRACNPDIYHCSSGGNQIYSSASGARVVPNSTVMECSNATHIFPTNQEGVEYLRHNIPSLGRPKESLYIYAYVGDPKWYYLDFAEGEGDVTDNGSKHELITALLEETNQAYDSSFIAVNSSIYRIQGTSEVHVLDLEFPDGLFVPSWKKCTPLVKDRVKPRAVFMGGKIYVVGVEKRRTCESRAKSGLLRTNYELNDIEILTGQKSRKWESCPIHFTFDDFCNYFVVAFEDHNKLVIGKCDEKCLYLYDVYTHDIERLDLDMYVTRKAKYPPVIVGNRLFWFTSWGISASDLVERCFWRGTIDGLDYSFFSPICDEDEKPKLIYLGGGKFCLICCKSLSYTVHCCLFGIPEFRVQGGNRSLHGHVHSVHKFYVGNIHHIYDVLVM